MASADPSEEIQSDGQSPSENLVPMLLSQPLDQPLDFPIAPPNEKGIEMAVLAAAFTEQFCIVGRGIMYHLSRPPRKTGGKGLAIEWNFVPHLLYVDKIWTDEDKQSWLELPLDARLNALNGRFRIHNFTLVMPITADFTGQRCIEKSEDDHPRVCGSLDGETGPLVALSVPNKAYLGWVSDMISQKPQDSMANYTKQPVGSGFGLTSIHKVAGERRTAAEINDWRDMVRRLHRMRDECKENSIVFFETVREWLRNAEEAGETETASRATSED